MCDTAFYANNGVWYAEKQIEVREFVSLKMAEIIFSISSLLNPL